MARAQTRRREMAERHKNFREDPVSTRIEKTVTG